MGKTHIKDATVINEGQVQQASVLIDNEVIEGIYVSNIPDADTIVDAKGCWLMPGVIDDHVHLRDPGLTHKADMKQKVVLRLRAE